MTEWTTPGLEPRDPPADFGTRMNFGLTSLTHRIQKAAPAINAALQDVDDECRRLQERFASAP